MKRSIRQSIKSFIPESVISSIVKYQSLSYVLREFGGRHKRECPICDYRGYFFGFGAPFRYDAVCPRCRSRERHRQHHLLCQKNAHWIDGARLLHFTPEPCFVADYQKRASEYLRADYFPGPDEVRVDMQRMQFDESRFDTIFCHQVIEHVDDDKAGLAEMFRVLRPGGVLILSTPVIETWSETYVNASVSDPWSRDLHFGQDDHTRYYGRNFRMKVIDAGFNLTEDIAKEPDVARFGLVRGEVIFIATKPG